MTELGDCPAPFFKRTDPEIPIVLGPDQVPSQIEKIGDSSMSRDESLSLTHRFNLSHASLSCSNCFMRLLCSVVLILVGAVDRISNQFSVSDSIASQLIGYDLSGLTTVIT